MGQRIGAWLMPQMVSSPRISQKDFWSRQKRGKRYLPCKRERGVIMMLSSEQFSALHDLLVKTYKWSELSLLARKKMGMAIQEVIGGSEQAVLNDVHNDWILWFERKDFVTTFIRIVQEDQCGNAEAQNICRALL
jgi:hypothetical protein